MSTFASGNRRAMREHNSENQSLATSPRRPTTSFTPINPHGATPQFISPMKTIKRQIDSDSSISGSEENRKASLPRSKKGRSKSTVWGELSTGVEQLQLEGAATKRRKPTPQEHSKSANAPSRLGSFTVEDTSDHATFPDYKENHDERPVFLITTPPIPNDKPKARAKTLGRSFKAKRPVLFKASRISKPLPVEKNEPTPAAVRSPPSNHPGWTTTENTIKSYSRTASLSQTTMSKLNSFRYNPVIQQPATSSPTLTTQAIQPVPGSQAIQTHRQEPYQLSYEYGFIRSADDVCMGGLEHDPDFLPNDHTYIQQRKHTNVLNNMSIESADQTESAMYEEAPKLTLSDPTSDFEPDSSEAKAFTQLLGNIEDTPDKNSASNQAPASLLYDVFIPDESDRSLPIQENESLDNITQKPPTDKVAQNISSQDLLLSLDQITDIQEPKGEDLRQQFHVEQSVISKYDNILIDDLMPSEDDEFDDGLDDSDLLEILSKSLMLDAQDSTTSILDDMHSSLVLIPPLNRDREAQKTRTINKEPPPRVASPILVSPRVLGSDSGDEFPMDESDEEEMLKLPELDSDTPNQLRSPQNLHNLDGRNPGSSEVYNNTSRTSPHKSISRTTNEVADSSPRLPAYIHSELSPFRGSEPRSDLLGEGEEWVRRRSTNEVLVIDRRIIGVLEDPDGAELSELEQLSQPTPSIPQSNLPRAVRYNPSTRASASSWKGHPDYRPLQAFARPDFPNLVQDRSPVVGLSAQTFLRTCFKIGEMFKEGKRCNSFGQDAIVELFARVTFSSREPGTTKQYFVFADLWQDNPPFPEGILMNYKTTRLTDTESKAFVEAGEAKMARCLGRLKRDAKNATGWLLHIITIRETDWEEIRYTKTIVGAGGIKSEVI